MIVERQQEMQETGKDRIKQKKEKQLQVVHLEYAAEFVFEDRIT